MKPFSEFEGKNVEDAIKKACEELKTNEEDLKYAVISNGSTGIFGLVGVRKAKIRVETKEGGINNIETANDIDQKEDTASSLVDEVFEDTEKQKNNKKTKEDIIDRKTKDKRENNVPQEIIDLGKETLKRIVDLITTGATISVKQRPEKIIFDIEGGESGVIIGKRGQNLEAIQYIVDKVLNKKSDQRVRLQVDVGGYLEKRKTNLKRLALKLATKTKKTGKPSTIGEINAHERRIVHMALKGDKKVRTQSVGDGYYRKLIVFPIKNNSKKD
jgi:spoIIIJ-associated protein